MAPKETKRPKQHPKKTKKIKMLRIWLIYPDAVIWWLDLKNMIFFQHFQWRRFRMIDLDRNIYLSSFLVLVLKLLLFHLS